MRGLGNLEYAFIEYAFIEAWATSNMPRNYLLSFFLLDLCKLISFYLIKFLFIINLNYHVCYNYYRSEQ
jgi:hypothetical protein